jgi:hypothetical protein
MSGKYNKRDGFVYLHLQSNKLDPFHIAVIESMFDEQADYDIEDINLEIEEGKLFRKVCIVKTLIFPLEVLVTKLVMGKPWTSEKIKAQGIYWKFLRKKITLEELKKEIIKIASLG